MWLIDHASLYKTTRPCPDKDICMGTNKTWLLSFTAVVWFTSVSSQNSKLCDLLVKAAQQEIFQKQFFGRDESQDIILLDTSKYLGSCSPVLLSGKRRLSVRQASGLKSIGISIVVYKYHVKGKTIRFGFNDRIQVRPWNWDSGINLESGY